MAKFHINPNTGEPGLCKATISCPFGGEDNHFDSPEAARAVFEDRMADQTFNQAKVATASATPTMFASDKARSLLSTVVGKDYDQVISNAKERASLATDYFNGKVKTNVTMDDFARATSPASEETANDARAALSARRRAGRAAVTARNYNRANAKTTSDARGALSARKSNQMNNFAKGVVLMGALQLGTSRTLRKMRRS